jgi:Tol biopolymer transport system component
MSNGSEPEAMGIVFERRTTSREGVDVREWISPDIDLICPYFHQRFITEDQRFLLCEGRFEAGSAVVRLDMADHEAVRLTAPGASPHGGDLSSDGRFFYFVRGQHLCRVEVGTGKEEALLHFPTRELTFLRQVHLSPDGAHLVVGANRVHASGVKTGDVKVVDLRTGSIRTIVSRPFQIGHVQFSTSDPGLVMYCHETGGASPQRMWLARLDSAHPGALYDRPGHPWVTHETFCGNGKRIVFIRNPEGVGTIRPDNSDAETFEVPGAWHPGPSRTADRIVFDTHGNGLGILWTGNGKYTILSRGERTSDAPHMHPRFAPDDKTVVWTASRDARPHPACANLEHVVPE